MFRGRGEPRRFGRGGEGFRRGGPGRGRGGMRGGMRGGRRGGPGARGGQNVVIEPHPAFEGVFVMHSKGDDALVTRNFAPGTSVYNEKRVTVGVPQTAHELVHRKAKRRSSTECGTLSDPSWARPSWVALRTST